MKAREIEEWSGGNKLTLPPVDRAINDPRWVEPPIFFSCVYSLVLIFSNHYKDKASSLRLALISSGFLISHWDVI